MGFQQLFQKRRLSCSRPIAQLAGITVGSGLLPKKTHQATSGMWSDIFGCLHKHKKSWETAAHASWPGLTAHPVAAQHFEFDAAPMVFRGVSRTATVTAGSILCLSGICWMFANSHNPTSQQGHISAKGGTPPPNINHGSNLHVGHCASLSVTKQSV